jgi:hypothetical protein
MSFLISDGYTETAFFAERPRLHGPVTFRFRPFTHPQRYAVQKTISERSGTAQSAAVQAVIVRQVTEWTIVDAKGEPLAITPENVARLKPVLIERMFSCVMGYEAGDMGPEASVDLLTLELEAAAEGISVGEARERRDEKN